MKKEVIQVPKGTRYLKELQNFELPNGILNKNIPNCGATTLAIEDKHKTVICSPRNNLIKNKHEQYPDTLLVIGNFPEAQISEYLNQTETPKILVSYDSFPKVAKCISDKNEWRIVVDEFQYLVADSNFKSETEFRFLESLKDFEYVTYLSATPILDKYIQQIKHFSDIPYYELQWQNIERIKVIRHRTSNPISAALEIVNSYKKGIYPKINENENIRHSHECVIYLNSVTNIINIIKQTQLSPEDVNIIVANSLDNEDFVKKLGDNFKIGRIPLYGEKHKMFTFCTSTAFAGCDFYSTNATSFVISDSKRVHTTIDIATDLVQIAGRQRLQENMFNKYIVLIYNTCNCDKTEEEFEKYLQKKENLTKSEIESNNNVTDPALKDKRIRDVCRLQKMLNYNETFIMYDSNHDKFVFNEMAMLSERFSFDLQKHNYINGIVVKEQLENHKFDVSTPEFYGYYENQMYDYIKRESFTDRMKKYCCYKERDAKFNLGAMLLEEKYPELKFFYDALGKERIKSLGYKEINLKNELDFKHKKKVLQKLMAEQLSGKTLKSEEIKNIMNNVYSSLGLKKTGKVSDLQNFGLDYKLHKITVAIGVRKNVYEINKIEEDSL